MLETAMRASRTLFAAPLLIACAGAGGCLGAGAGRAGPIPAKASTAATTPAAPPALDLPTPWVDLELERVTVRPRPVPTRQAARNPRATPIILRGGTILTATGARYERGTLVLEGGAITYVGDGPGPSVDGARVIDVTGKVITPGLIDAHSHLGLWPAPSTRAHNDGNEMTAPVTGQADARYGYAPQDPQIVRAMAGGVTTALILPGSANLVGGRGFTVEMRPGRTADEVAFPGAPATVKMACGENPKRVYGDKGGPQTRMGEYAAFRTAFLEAAAYAGKHAAYRRQRAAWDERRRRAGELDAAAAAVGAGSKPIPGEPAPEPPAVDLKLETLAGVLRGEVLVQIHCYRASEMAEMMAIAHEFGFRIRSFHHALEAYKIRDLLVADGIAINTWADWWGFKMEAFDGIPENAGLFTEQGGIATIHSDSPMGIQRLNQEAAKAMAAASAAGIAVSETAALRWITANPAWVLGLDHVVGTLEVGKRADVVVWSGSPLSVYTLAQQVFMAGELVFDRAARPLTDFELGNSAADRAMAPPTAKPAAAGGAP